MITGDAWAYFISCLSDLYQWASSTTIIGFGQYSITLFDLWISFTSIVIFVELILAPIFGSGNGLLAWHKYNREDDSYD